MSYEIVGMGAGEAVRVNYADESGPFWLVVCDDTPEMPELPLPLGLALHQFELAAKDADEGETVELRQCDADDLAFAGLG